jgi:hypothetical protein
MEAKDDLVDAGSQRVNIALFVRQKPPRFQFLGRHVGNRAFSCCAFLALCLYFRNTEVAQFEHFSSFEYIDRFYVFVHDAGLQKRDQPIAQLIKKVVDLLLR